ncbi:MAG: Clp protease ClpP [Muribaculaceae bacterium]|nr:Clp protease ClpP [Muribaculaceae bacterium]
MATKYHLKLKGYVGGWNFDADYVDYILEKNADKEVQVLINSLGGDVATAFSVSAAFKRHGNVHVHYESMNASAATIASLGAKRVSIDVNAMYLVHKCSQMVFRWDMMNADQLQQLIDECEKTKKDLDKIDLNIAGAYASRCKKDKNDLLGLMKEGGWLSAQEALDWGFVDEITSLPEDEKPRITEDVVNFMAAEGIPMPRLPEESAEQGVLSRLMEALSSLFRRENTNQITAKMKKTYVNVCKLLQCEHLEIEDGNITVTEEQVQAIEDKMSADVDHLSTSQRTLADRDKEIADLKAQLEGRNRELEALRKQPAEPTAQVIDNGSEGDVADDYFSAVADATEMLNILK